MAPAVGDCCASAHRRLTSWRDKGMVDGNLAWRRWLHHLVRQLLRQRSGMAMHLRIWPRLRSAISPQPRALRTTLGTPGHTETARQAWCSGPARSRIHACDFPLQRVVRKLGKDYPDCAELTANPDHCGWTAGSVRLGLIRIHANVGH